MGAAASALPCPLVGSSRQSYVKPVGQSTRPLMKLIRPRRDQGGSVRALPAHSNEQPQGPKHFHDGVLLLPNSESFMSNQFDSYIIITFSFSACRCM
jgi:hypothetical protein